MNFFSHEANGGATCTGNNLCDSDQQHVLRAYVHRFTGQHRPAWADDRTPLHFKDDNEWLANTRFAIDTNGRLRQSVKDCNSRPTFPNNPEFHSKSPNPRPGIHNVQ